MAWDNFIEELKMQVNIVDVVGREVGLKKAGANYKGLCPFHSEKTPSFFVNEERQSYHCFGCGQRGDVIEFVKSYYKIPFIDAVEKLAGDYGIKMPERMYQAPKLDYGKYYDINALAARYFYNCLGIRGNPGLAYLRKRGLSKDTITRFGLGYAPGRGTLLTDYLASEGVSVEDMLKLGLTKESENGLYDNFRNRVMFPIINTQDKVIGFGGRAIGDSKAKYLNSPESEIFLKKNNLFGLNFARSEITSQDRAIIVEGYMDVISLHQSGIKNVCASLGTALTDNQAKLLCRYSKNVVLSYDSDDAGIRAALRGISVISGAGGKPKVLTVTDGKDPDEYIQKHGKDEFIKLADDAVPAAEFRLRLERRGFDLNTDQGVLDYIDRIVPVLRGLGPVEQDMYVRKLSSEFGISEHAILMAVRTEGGSSGRPSGRNVQRRPHDKRHTSAGDGEDGGIEARIEMSFALLAIYNTRYLRRYEEDGIHLRTRLASMILSVCSSLADTEEAGMHRIDPGLISDKLDPADDAVFHKYLSSVQIGPDDEVFYKETKKEWHINKLRTEKSWVRNELAIAEKNGNQDEINELAARLISIDNEIKKMQEDNGGQ